MNCFGQDIKGNDALYLIASIFSQANMFALLKEEAHHRTCVFLKSSSQPDHLHIERTAA
jgi:hypothetical protein